MVLLLMYNVYTATSSGTISTQHFGEEFNDNKVGTGPLDYSVYVNPPDSVWSETIQSTLHVNPISEGGGADSVHPYVL